MSIEVLKQIVEAWDSQDFNHIDSTVDSLRAVIEKAQPEQEPVATGTEWFQYWNAVEGWVSVPIETRPFAWAKLDELAKHMTSVGCGTVYYSSGEGRMPLYTTPPQRKPKNLMQVIRTSDQSVKLVFTSCAAASEFENCIKGDA